jgi:hypothetical protein
VVTGDEIKGKIGRISNGNYNLTTIEGAPHEFSY